MSTHPRQHARPTQQARPQMAQRPARRLPPARRLDYILIPAPLDLSLSSLSTLSEKSPLPSIIVTPSSPTHFRSGSGGGFGGEFGGGRGEGIEGTENEGREYEYAIAFMVQPKPPSVFQRVVGSVKDGVERGVQRVKQAVPIPARWTWRRGYAPIALPISAPATQTEFTIPTFPPEKRKTNRVVVVLTAVFVLVFCHMLAHFFTRASLPSSIPLSSSANFGLGSTSPVLPSPGYMVPATLPEEGVKAKAYAFLGKMEVKQWLAWVVGGAGRKRGGA